MSILTGSGVAGVFCVLFIIGRIFPKAVVDDLKEELRETKGALAAERERADSSVAAASATRDILTAIQVGRDLTSGHSP